MVLNMLKKLTIRTRLILTMVLLGLIILAFGLLGVFGMRSLEASLEDVYSNQLVSSISVNDSKNSLSRARFAIDRAALHPEDPEVGKTLERVAAFLAESDKSWAAYMALPQDAEESVLARDVVARRDVYVREGLLALADAVKKRDAAAIDSLNNRLLDLYNDFNDAAGKLDQYQIREAKSHYESGVHLADKVMVTSIAGIVIGALLIVASSVSLVRAIMGPLNQALRHFHAMAEGDLATSVIIEREDEMGKLLAGPSRPRAR